MRYSALLMLKVTPQFRQFASTLPGLGIDDAMSLPQSITYPDEIIKSGKASMQCMPIILSCLNSLRLATILWIEKHSPLSHQEHSDLRHGGRAGLYFSGFFIRSTIEFFFKHQ
jgi:hypothetical protein